MANPIAFINRPAHFAAAVLLSVTALLPAAVMLGRADAAQVEDRFIQLANSEAGASGVEYTIEFKVPSTTAIEGIVVDICSNSPLIGVSCTAPAAFAWGTPTLSNGDIGATDVTGWTETTLNSGRTLVLNSGGTGVTPTANDTVRLVMTGVTNPSAVGTFYGRMITFNDNSVLGAYDPSDGDDTPEYIDVGGAAMSTINNLTVTARVQESLVFCVYTNGPGQDCAGGLGSAIDIPDALTPLSSSSLQTATAFFSLASNALNGVSIRMWSADAAADGVLRSGSNTIDAFGSGDDGACSTLNAGAEQFGLRVVPSGSVTAASPYNGAANCYGWDADAAGVDTTKVGSSYGDPVATTGGAHDEEESQMIFAAKSSLTTQAGIYSTELNYIATGTY